MTAAAKANNIAWLQNLSKEQEVQSGAKVVFMKQKIAFPGRKEFD